MKSKSITIKLSEEDHKKLCHVASFNAMTPQEWLEKYFESNICSQYTTLMKHLSKLH